MKLTYIHSQYIKCLGLGLGVATHCSDEIRIYLQTQP